MATLTAGYGKTYETFDAAYAAATQGDTIQLYKLQNGLRKYVFSTTTFDKGFSLVGSDDGIEVQLSNVGQTFTAANSQFNFSNLNIIDLRTNLGNIGSTGFWFDRCLIDEYERFIIDNASNTGTFRWTNCIVRNYYASLGRATIHAAACGAGCKVQVYNSVIFGIQTQGYDYGPIVCGDADATVEVYNSKLIYPTANWYTGSSQTGKLYYDYCDFVTANTGGNPGANNSVKTVDEMGFAYIVGQCQGGAADYRTVQSYERDGTTTANGVDLTTLFTTDICGSARPATAAGYSPGCSYSFRLYETPTYTAAANVRLGTDRGDGVTGTLDLPAEADVKKDVVFDGETKTGTYDPTGEPPGAPTITAATPGDTQVTLAMTADDAADVVYARYRSLPSGAWAAESETFKRTGSGNIVVTGLTNGTKYELSAYAKSDSLTSDWSATVETTPTTGAGIMTVEEAIRRRLLAASGLTALVSTRIYPQVAPQSAKLPFLVFTRIDGDPDQHMSAESGFSTMRAQIDSYAASYSAVKALANQVRLALNGYQGIVVSGSDSITLGSIQMENDQDISPILSDGEDVPRYSRVTQDYIVTHSQEVPTF